MPTGPQAEQLAIGHVGNGRERMPVSSMRVRPCPLHPINRETAVHARILGYVNAVVVIDEVVRDGLAEDGPDQYEQDNANTGGNGRDTKANLGGPRARGHWGCFWALP